jgi:hypothetical protein
MAIIKDRLEPETRVAMRVPGFGPRLGRLRRGVGCRTAIQVKIKAFSGDAYILAKVTMSKNLIFIER